MKPAKRARLMVAKAERRPLHLGPPTSEADDRIEGKWERATHRPCGSPGRIDVYWRIAECSACGVVPCAEMKR